MAGTHGAHRAPRVSRVAARQARKKRARRQLQLFGAALVVVLLIGIGVYVVSVVGGNGGPATQAGNNTDEDTSQLLAEETFLLDTTVTPRLAPGTWQITATNEGAQAPERSFTCQASRFADPAGQRTWVRQFKSADASAVQYVELSTDAGTAEQAYTTVSNWLASCATPQQRLVASYSANGLGDRGMIAVFAQPAGGGKERYRTLAVTSTGPATMVLESVTLSAAPPSPAAPVAVAAIGMSRLCAETKTTCPSSQVIRPALLPAVGEPPGFMAAIDLPVLSTVKEPWVGVDAGNRPPTDCGETNQAKARPARTASRTYLPVGAKVPTEFGMDTKVMQFASPAQAATYLSAFGTTLDGCAKTHSNVTVRKAARVPNEAGSTGRTWQVKLGLTGGGSLTYRVGAARAGNKVAYQLFLSIKGFDISDAEFAASLARGAHRALSFK